MKPYRGFADTVRARRKELGLTLADVADAMAWSVPYISELERGVKQPPMGEMIHRLAQILGLDPFDLDEKAEMSRRSIEIDLDGASPSQRKAVALLNRRLREGRLTDEEAERIIREYGE